MAQRLNLEEIGRLAGVSRSTVSRVVNGEPNVSPEARRKVEEVVASTGYRPHAAARSLAARRTGVVGLVIPSSAQTLFDDPYFGRLILGLTAAANTIDTTLALFLFDSELDEDPIVPRVVNSGMVDGVIVTATSIGDPVIDGLVDAELPFVVVGRPDSRRVRFSVDADNSGGARQAVRHLIGLGHRRIGLIAPPSSSTAGVDRRDGYLSEMAAAGLPVDGLLRQGDWSEESGRRAMASLLADQPDRAGQPDRPDQPGQSGPAGGLEAVFVGSDRMAVGALRALRDAGLRCPDDVALVSFDGLLSADQVTPRLTSVIQPVSEVGQRAALLLHAVIEGRATAPEAVVLPTELVVRESCGSTGSP